MPAPLHKSGLLWHIDSAATRVFATFVERTTKDYPRIPQVWEARVLRAIGRTGALLISEYAGQADSDRRQAYRALFRAHMDEALVEEIRSATNGNYALGSERFQKQIEVALGRRAVRGTAGRPRKAALADDGQQSLL